MILPQFDINPNSHIRTTIFVPHSDFQHANVVVLHFGQLLPLVVVVGPRRRRPPLLLLLLLLLLTVEDVVSDLPEPGEKCPVEEHDEAEDDPLTGVAQVAEEQHRAVVAVGPQDQRKLLQTPTDAQHEEQLDQGDGPAVGGVGVAAPDAALAPLGRGVAPDAAAEVVRGAQVAQQGDDVARHVDEVEVEQQRQRRLLDETPTYQDTVI